MADFARVKREWGLTDTPAPPEAAGTAPVSTFSATETDPRRVLLSVMNDPALEMALRIEAAKALLPR